MKNRISILLLSLLPLIFSTCAKKDKQPAAINNSNNTVIANLVDSVQGIYLVSDSLQSWDGPSSYDTVYTNDTINIDKINDSTIEVVFGPYSQFSLTYDSVPVVHNPSLPNYDSVYTFDNYYPGSNAVVIVNFLKSNTDSIFIFSGKEGTIGGTNSYRGKKIN